MYIPTKNIIKCAHHIIIELIVDTETQIATSGQEFYVHEKIFYTNLYN